MSDRGAARRRTWLAWNRTGLAAAAFGALVLRIGLAQDRPLDVAAAIAAGVTAAVMGLVSRRDPAPIGPAPFVVVTCCVMATAVITSVGLFA